MIRKIVLLFMLFSLFPLIAFADLKVTAVKSSSDKYEVILNNAVKLKNLTVKKDKSGEYVVFPTYASKGKLYIQFGVLRRDFNRVDQLSAIKENKVSQSGGEISFEINKFSRVKNHENVEAFCSV
ncbi:MAG: hypothetical protein LBB93_00395, partial [Elusimicrobiota bacterium]|nr:hypothetical protein [Elusimicrobiota bacterium]